MKTVVGFQADTVMFRAILSQPLTATSSQHGHSSRSSFTEQDARRRREAARAPAVCHL